jgi:hypothetical protein
MDCTSPSLPEQQKWNEFVSKFTPALDGWQQNNSGKIPTDLQKREIAQEILFPNGAPEPFGGATEGDPRRSDTNTGTNTNGDTNLLESAGNLVQTDKAQDWTEVSRDADSANRDVANQENRPILDAGVGPQDISGKSGEAYDALSRGRPLNNREKDLLRPYIPEEDLNTDS